MRKFIAMLLALALITPFSIGCGDKKKTEKKETKEKTTETNGKETTEKTEKTETDEKTDTTKDGK